MAIDDVDVLRDAIACGDELAAGELVRRFGFTSIDAALAKLWPDGISPVGHRALIEGFRPYVLEPWERELQHRRDTQP